MQTIQYELKDGIATLTFDEPGSPVNTMCAQWQTDLVEATAQVVKDKDAIKGIVLASNKTTFFAGADLKGTMRLQPTDASRVFAEIEQTKKCFRTLETLGKPVVSCLNGAALGGGWEVALVGHYRVAIDNPKIQLGLPEITLGLIPGASGITKMTRLLGLMGAQPYILEMLAALGEVGIAVKAGAAGRQEDDIACGGLGLGDIDGLGQCFDADDVDAAQSLG